MRITTKKARAVGNRLGMNWNEYDLNEFRMGLEVELEHRDLTHGDLLKTGIIARAHLNENPSYYSVLKEVGL